MSHRRVARLQTREESPSYIGFDSRGWYFVKQDLVFDAAPRIIANAGRSMTKTKHSAMDPLEFLDP